MYEHTHGERMKEGRTGKKEGRTGEREK